MKKSQRLIVILLITTMIAAIISYWEYSHEYPGITDNEKIILESKNYHSLDEAQEELQKAVNKEGAEWEYFPSDSSGGGGVAFPRTSTPKVHGNSSASTKTNHLYEIFETSTNKTVKIGISSGKITKSGQSYRANTQVSKWGKINTIIVSLEMILMVDK